MCGPAQKEKPAARGMTMVELLLSIAAGAIVILGVYRLLTQSLWSYNLQEQMTDMYQNATYSIKKLSEELSQVGADLPDSAYTVVYVANSFTDSVTMRVNTKGARQKMTAAITGLSKIPVDSGNAFVGMDSIVVDTGQGVAVTKQLDSVRVSSTPCTVYIAPATITLKSGDVVYGALTRRYFVRNRNLYFNDTSKVLAENIDSLAMTFYDHTKTATTNWKDMALISLYVRARTASPDPKYRHPVYRDGYHRLALSMDLRLRNKY
jgi:prepilin-type N-terminal cleavage/methylation domain-containing protein